MLGKYCPRIVETLPIQFDHYQSQPFVIYQMTEVQEPKWIIIDEALQIEGDCVNAEEDVA